MRCCSQMFAAMSLKVAASSFQQGILRRFIKLRFALENSGFGNAHLSEKNQSGLGSSKDFIR